MLVLPELDTYGVLKKYAEHPDDVCAVSAFLMLIKRAKRRINWELHDFLGFDMPYKDKLALRLDSAQLLDDNKESTARPLTLSDWKNMSDTEVKDTYMSLLKASGMMPDMDPDGSMSSNNDDT